MLAGQAFCSDETRSVMCVRQKCLGDDAIERQPEDPPGVATSAYSTAGTLMTRARRHANIGRTRRCGAGQCRRAVPRQSKIKLALSSRLPRRILHRASFGYSTNGSRVALARSSSFRGAVVGSVVSGAAIY